MCVIVKCSKEIYFKIMKRIKFDEGATDFVLNALEIKNVNKKNIGIIKKTDGRPEIISGDLTSMYNHVEQNKIDMKEKLMKEVTDYCNNELKIENDDFTIDFVTSTRESSGNFCLYITTRKIIKKDLIRSTFVNLSFVNKLYRSTATKLTSELYKYTIVFKMKFDDGNTIS